MINDKEIIKHLKYKIEELEEKNNELEEEINYYNNKKYDLSDFIDCYYDDLRFSKYNNDGVYIGDFEHKRIYILLK